VIPYGRQHVDDSDIEAVTRILRSDFLTQGPAVPRFEMLVAETCGARYGVATNSATSALHVACLALGLQKGDLLWTSPITFVASANCARYCGADVDFVDIDSRTYNMSPEALKEKLELAAKTDKLPKVVVPVHMGGQSCEMRAIKALALQYNFKIIEDASHALGALYESEFVGNCRYSDITVFSFHPVKIVTTGEGGMALTNDPTLAEAMRQRRSHGIEQAQANALKIEHGGWYYEQRELGYNYRMTDVQAALGASQLATSAYKRR
jgi:dTDP-4-amino-4,6-dideoxygalactose transaminase